MSGGVYPFRMPRTVLTGVGAAERRRLMDNNPRALRLDEVRALDEKAL
jgi:hypothetical protein